MTYQPTQDQTTTNIIPQGSARSHRIMQEVTSTIDDYLKWIEDGHGSRPASSGTVFVDWDGYGKPVVSSRNAARRVQRHQPQQFQHVYPQNTQHEHLQPGRPRPCQRIQPNQPQPRSQYQKARIRTPIPQNSVTRDLTAEKKAVLKSHRQATIHVQSVDSFQDRNDSAISQDLRLETTPTTKPSCPFPPPENLDHYGKKPLPRLPPPKHQERYTQKPLPALPIYPQKHTQEYHCAPLRINKPLPRTPSPPPAPPKDPIWKALPPAPPGVTAAPRSILREGQTSWTRLPSIRPHSPLFPPDAPLFSNLGTQREKRLEETKEKEEVRKLEPGDLHISYHAAPHHSMASYVAGHDSSKTMSFTYDGSIIQVQRAESLYAESYDIDVETYDVRQPLLCRDVKGEAQHVTEGRKSDTRKRDRILRFVERVMATLCSRGIVERLRGERRRAALRT
ncbi:hypothetical protein P153DRAFT_353109 [Dothidotthia symphoricarpi CBS 119687]|uniref:Uncharacterized protein n=1 Tax=Dothidotthia symphoricarpi CBS 119687 TaxID=1392245 RepID=A0A6A6ASP2_9PLEO|nr:uncharacterized protein P153DRAFT_353109 [Dothidotthia symphoricarpi CBS 119687]KAF2133877.1 hypothetical protein P153DRAFT_353109 [Dothidotthia symphoricarpi CBS 119687]